MTKFITRIFLQASFLPSLLSGAMVNEFRSQDPCTRISQVRLGHSILVGSSPVGTFRMAPLFPAKCLASIERKSADDGSLVFSPPIGRYILCSYLFPRGQRCRLLSVFYIVSFSYPYDQVDSEARCSTTFFCTFNQGRSARRKDSVHISSRGAKSPECRQGHVNISKSTGGKRSGRSGRSGGIDNGREIPRPCSTEQSIERRRPTSLTFGSSLFMLDLEIFCSACINGRRPDGPEIWTEELTISVWPTGQLTNVADSSSDELQTFHKLVQKSYHFCTAEGTKVLGTTFLEAGRDLSRPHRMQTHQHHQQANYLVS